MIIIRPDHPLDSIYCRAMTYRNREQARRSFYKFCAKEGLCGKLYLLRPGELHPWGGTLRRETHWRRPSGGWGSTTYAHGYPAYGHHRSEAMRQWEEIFFERKKAVLAQAEQKAAEIHAQELARHEARRRVRAVSKPRTRQFFKMFGAGAALQQNL